MSTAECRPNKERDWLRWKPWQVLKKVTGFSPKINNWEVVYELLFYQEYWQKTHLLYTKDTGKGFSERGREECACYALTLEILIILYVWLGRFISGIHIKWNRATGHPRHISYCFCFVYESRRRASSILVKIHNTACSPVESHMQWCPMETTLFEVSALLL